MGGDDLVQLFWRLVLRRFSGYTLKTVSNQLGRKVDERRINEAEYPAAKDPNRVKNSTFAFRVEAAKYWPGGPNDQPLDECTDDDATPPKSEYA